VIAFGQTIRWGSAGAVLVSLLMIFPLRPQLGFELAHIGGGVRGGARGRRRCQWPLRHRRNDLQQHP